MAPTLSLAYSRLGQDTLMKVWKDPPLPGHPACFTYSSSNPTKNTRVTTHIHSVHHNFEPLFAESMVSRASRPFWAWILFGWALDAIRSCRKERRQRKRRKLEASRPRLSQTHRSRSLSVGFSENQNIQSYSRLFTMLPLEIRLQINL